jgi:hypothetical protein
MAQEKEFKLLDALPEGYDSPDDVPDCASERCKRIQELIDKACEARGWPPGTPYIIENPDGNICKCYCK